MGFFDCMCETYVSCVFYHMDRIFRQIGSVLWVNLQVFQNVPCQSAEFSASSCSCNSFNSPRPLNSWSRMLCCWKLDVNIKPWSLSTEGIILQAHMCFQSPLQKVEVKKTPFLTELRPQATERDRWHWSHLCWQKSKMAPLISMDYNPGSSGQVTEIFSERAAAWVK